VPKTPDRRPGPLIEDEEIQLGTNAAAPTLLGAMRFDGAAFQFKDALGVYDPRDGTGGGGLTDSAHAALNQLIHFMDEGPGSGFASGATKVVTGTAFPTQILWKRADTTSLVERNLTWTGPVVTTDNWIVYDDDGTTVLAAVTDAISYSGIFETSRTRTINEYYPGGASLTEATHAALDQLIHFIDDGPAEFFASGATRTTTGTAFPTQILWKRADATALVERNLTWTGVLLTTDEWKMYAPDGVTVLATATDTISYSGPFETSRVRAIA
jgi:hypothetical protein